MSKLSDLTKTPETGRPLHKRLTLVGGAVAAGGYFLDNEAARPGTFAAFEAPHPLLLGVMCLGVLVMLFGIYRHITDD